MVGAVALAPFAPGALDGVSLAVLDSPIRVNAGDPFRVRVSIANRSGATLGAYRYWHPHPLFLGYVWTDRSTGVQLPLDYVLTSLWRPLRPGEHGVLHARVQAPRSTGSYLLTIALLQRGGRWYDNSSEVRPVYLEVEVRSDLAALPHSIDDFEDSVYSQNGEDGILRELFLRLGYSDPFSVEFGAGDGLEGSNTAYWLRHYGWSGLMIEASSDFPRLQKNYERYPGVRTASEFLSAENIAGIFRANEVPKEFDLLSIDVDGNDYWLWEALAEYRPRVVVIETNRIFKPPELWVMSYNPRHTWNAGANRNYHGASLESLARLGKRLGYALLGTADDLNAFFLRRDLLERSRFPELTASQAFHDHTLTWPPGWTPAYQGPYVEQ